MTAGHLCGIHLADGPSWQMLRHEQRGGVFAVEGGSRLAARRYRVRDISVMRVTASLQWLPSSYDRVLVFVFENYICRERLL